MTTSRGGEFMWRKVKDIRFLSTCSGPGTVSSTLQTNSPVKPRSRYACHFTEGETETQLHEKVCPRSGGQPQQGQDPNPTRKLLSTGHWFLVPGPQNWWEGGKEYQRPCSLHRLPHVSGTRRHQADLDYVKRRTRDPTSGSVVTVKGRKPALSPSAGLL